MPFSTEAKRLHIASRRDAHWRTERIAETASHVAKCAASRYSFITCEAIDIPSEVMELAQHMRLRGEGSISDRQRNKCIKLLPPGYVTSPFVTV